MQIINRTVPDKVLVCPIGDIQYGNPACSVKYLHRYLDWTKDMAKRLKSERLFIGTGDYIDFMSPSNRSRYRAAGLYSSSARLIDERVALPLVDEVFEMLKPHLKDRTIAMCRGHHYATPDSNAFDGCGDTDQLLASLLGAEFVDASAMIVLDFPTRKYKILATHGQGNGASMTYGLNKLDRQASGWEGVDAFFMGHTHKSGVVATVRLREEDGEVVSRQVPVMTCGAFLRTILVDDVNYAEEKQLAPLALSAGALSLEEVDSTNEGLLVAPMLLL